MTPADLLSAFEALKQQRDEARAERDEALKTAQQLRAVVSAWAEQVNPHLPFLQQVNVKEDAVPALRLARLESLAVFLHQLPGEDLGAVLVRLQELNAEPSPQREGIEV